MVEAHKSVKAFPIDKQSKKIQKEKFGQGKGKKKSNMKKSYLNVDVNAIANKQRRQ